MNASLFAVHTCSVDGCAACIIPAASDSMEGEKGDRGEGVRGIIACMCADDDMGTVIGIAFTEYADDEDDNDGEGNVNACGGAGEACVGRSGCMNDGGESASEAGVCFIIV